MNILVVCHYGLYQDLSFSFVHAQAKEYAAMGHRVKVVVPIAVGKKDWTDRRWNSHSFADNDGVIISFRYISLSSYGKRLFNTVSAIFFLKHGLSKLLGDFQPDIIHAHTLGFDSEIGAWLKSKLGVPLVVTTHGSDTTIPMEQGNSVEMRTYCQKADHIVAVSSVLGNRLRACGTTTPITSILNGYAARNRCTDVKKIPLSF